MVLHRLLQSSTNSAISAIVIAAWSATLTKASADDAPEAPASGFVSMFNGKDLTGWDGSPGWWQVHDGVLIGESTSDKPCQQTHYLYWQGGEPEDFDLRASYRLHGEANSGIQIRSKKIPPWDTWGYQADLDSAGVYTGCLYQHERGLVAQRGERVRINAAGVKSIEVIGDSAKLLESVRPNDWNEYRVLAEGPSVTLWINGQRICQVEDHEERFALPRGVIALQLHQGPPMKVEFKDLRIRVLK